MSILFTAIGATGQRIPSDALFFNLSNVNAGALWRAIHAPGSPTWGELSIDLLEILVAPVASSLEALELPAAGVPEIEYRRGRGARGARVLDGELTADGLAARVLGFRAFLREARAAGATAIAWS